MIPGDEAKISIFGEVYIIFHFHFEPTHFEIVVNKIADYQILFGVQRYSDTGYLVWDY